MVLVVEGLEEAVLVGLKAREHQAQERGFSAPVFEVDDGVGRRVEVWFTQVHHDAVVPGGVVATVGQVDSGDFLHVRRSGLAQRSGLGRRGGVAPVLAVAHACAGSGCRFRYRLPRSRGRYGPAQPRACS